MLCQRLLTVALQPLPSGGSPLAIVRHLHTGFAARASTGARKTTTARDEDHPSHWWAPIS